MWVYGELINFIREAKLETNQIKNGQMFQKVNETDRNGGGGLYEVLDITVNKIRDYEVGVAIIGKVGTTDTMAVQLSDLTNHRQFRFKGEASLEVIKVHRLKYADGTIDILSEKLLSTSKVDNVKEVINAEAEKKSRPVTVYNITNNHRDTTMAKAFADAEVKKSKAVEKQEQPEEKDAEVVLTFDCKSIAFCTYHDLHVIGQFLKGHPDRMTNCHTRFKNSASKIAHQQTLDRFRDGNISLRDLRRYSHSTTRNLGSTLSLAGVVTRVAKAVVQLGTPMEKKDFGVE